MSVRTRLISATIVELLIFLLIILGIVVYTGRADRSNDQVRLTLRRLSQAQAVARGAGLELDKANDLLASSGTNYERTDYNRSVQRAFIAWEKSLMEAIDISGESSLGMRQKSLFDRVEALRKTYSLMAEQVEAATAASDTGNTQAAVSLASSANNTFLNTFTPGLEAVIDSEQANAAAADQQSRDATNDALVATLVLAPAGLAIIAVISILLMRDITKSLQVLKNGALVLGSGDLDVRIDTGKDDEFGEVADAFNTMAAELQLKTQELRQYAHTVSHDIKGPLTSTALASGLLADELEPLELQTNEGMALSELARIINTNIGATTDLIDQLLSLAEAGQVPAVVEQLDVRELVSRVLEEHEAEIEERGVEVRVDDDLGSLRANHTQMYQLFSNLLSNAIKHSGEQDPKFEVSYLGRDASGAHSYRIRDNSPGIEPGLLEHVFEPFAKGEQGGSGIGLATVQKVVSVYGGQITARNDNGAVFEFTLRDWQ